MALTSLVFRRTASRAERLIWSLWCVCIVVCNPPKKILISKNSNFFVQIFLVQFFFFQFVRLGISYLKFFVSVSVQFFFLNLSDLA